MTTTHNRHWLSTHQQLQTVVFDLLKHQPVASITVSQICHLININRSTFYAHFADVFDLVDQTSTIKRTELMAGFFASAKSHQLTFFNQESLVQFLQFIQTNGWFYKIILEGRQTFPIKEGLDQLYDRLITPVKKQQPQLTESELMYIFVAYQSSFTMILKRWAQSDYVLAPRQVANILIQSLPFVIHNALFERESRLSTP